MVLHSACDSSQFSCSMSPEPFGMNMPNGPGGKKHGKFRTIQSSTAVARVPQSIV